MSPRLLAHVLLVLGLLVLVPAGCVTVEIDANLPPDVPEFRYETPRTVACPPRTPSVPTSRATRVTSALKAFS